MDERLHQVLIAKTHSELVPALASFPEKNAPHPRLPPPADGSSGEAHGGYLTSSRSSPHAGRVHLDLSRAVIEHPVVDIELRLGTGRAKITVPRDAIVDFEELRTGWKDTLCKPPRRSPSGGPTLRISGTKGFGRSKIRHARR